MTACNSKFVDSLKGGLNFNLTYYEKLSGVEAPQEAAAISVKAFGEAVDLQPCGGTHIARTGEIGALRIGKIENKGAKNRRVHIHLEG